MTDMAIFHMSFSNISAGKGRSAISKRSIPWELLVINNLKYCEKSDCRLRCSCGREGALGGIKGDLKGKEVFKDSSQDLNYSGPWSWRGLWSDTDFKLLHPILRDWKRKMVPKRKAGI